MTKEEMIEIMDIYIAPLYQMIGAALALGVLVAAYLLILHPFIKRITK